MGAPEAGAVKMATSVPLNMALQDIPRRRPSEPDDIEAPDATATRAINEHGVRTT